MSQSINTAAERSDRIVGLDSIRFICASFVVFDHLGFIKIAKNTTHLHSLQNVMRALTEALFNGPAAVIIFFLISGFCIHYPFRDPKRPLALNSYLSRRLIRVGLPAAVFMLYLRLVLKDDSPVFATVLWSVQCELVYYVLYPALRQLSRLVRWMTMVAVTYTGSVALSLTHLHLLAWAQSGYIAFGYQLTWFIGLPVWILGCWLAENIGSFKAPSTRQIWYLRTAIFLFSWILRLIKFHTTTPFLSNIITLNLFAFPACYWLGCEIAYFTKHGAPRLLENSGRWSYSLYLAHSLVFPTIALLFGNAMLGESHWALHFLLLIFVFIVAYVFFLLVEYPSHKLAIRVSKLRSVLPRQAISKKL